MLWLREGNGKTLNEKKERPEFNITTVAVNELLVVLGKEGDRHKEGLEVNEV